MPEGDTVWLTARELHRALAGGQLVRWDMRVPRLATTDLTGRTLLEVSPRGKHVMMRFEGGITLHSHMRMDGAWRIYQPDEAWRGPRHQIRAIVGTASAVAVGFRLPVLELVRTSAEKTVVGHLGPDLLGPDWDPAEAVRRISADPARTIGEALMDQRNLAGIGNVYKSELCFLRGVTPWTPVGETSDLTRTVELAHELLEANKGRFGHITTGDTRRGHTNWVYGRARRPCMRCGTMVLTSDQGPAGEERVTYWCPTCQAGPGPR